MDTDLVEKNLRSLISKNPPLSHIPEIYFREYGKELHYPGRKLTSFLKEILGEDIIHKGLMCGLRQQVPTLATGPQNARTLNKKSMRAPSVNPVQKSTSAPKQLSKMAAKKQALESSIKTMPIEFQGLSLSDPTISNNPLETDQSQDNPEDIFTKVFYSPVEATQDTNSANSLLLGNTAYGRDRQVVGSGAGLFGTILPETTPCVTEDDKVNPDEHLYLNTQDPFCMVCVGVQGAGKSHTMNVALENCMMSCSFPTHAPVISQPQRMCTLLFHHSDSDATVYDGVGLGEVLSQYKNYVRSVERIVVLVSPTNYKNRKQFYGSFCEVKPLLFQWGSLNATQLKTLMRLSSKDNPLYVSVLLNILRDFQRKQRLPEYQSFLAMIRGDDTLKPGQTGPLQQRLGLLSTFIYESIANVDCREFSEPVMNLWKPGTLVVADMTDPMLSIDEVSGIFHVLLDLFQKNDSLSAMSCGKILACDEAHKYLSNEGGDGQEGLARAVVNVVRLMRHQGMRVIISTQSPHTMPPELLELVSMTVMHRFQSRDWYTFLERKVNIPEGTFDKILRLRPGEAIVICSARTTVNTGRDDNDDEGGDVVTTPQHRSFFKVKIRSRLTADRGATKRNTLHSGPTSKSDRAITPT